MSINKWKHIESVPTSQHFIDFTLSKTQRKTPTVIHKQFSINRIRDFYIKKVRFTQQNFTERLSRILEDFPNLDEIHPFYADLMNVLYDRDHFKVALSHVNNSKFLIQKVAKEYLRLLKYGDTMFRCKCLKKIALGKMVSIIKKIDKNLEYLEQVRQHLSRLPSMDPSSRTIILCGYPNVGKSSFMNKITRAEVDVQPYPFTTKSLYIGHTDYDYMRWQVIDTPGILDRPLEQRNTIEMQAVTALAHLHAAIVFFIDISETCGYCIEEQINLLKSIRPLFAGKPVVVALSKVDLMKPDDLSDENKQLITSLQSDNFYLVPLSSIADEGIVNLKQYACEAILKQRLESKLQQPAMKQVLNRLHTAVPEKRDDVTRPSSVPENYDPDAPSNVVTYTERRAAAGGLSSNFHINPKENFLLRNDSEKFDVIPEIVDGKNIADFIDLNLFEKLARLEEEERIREETGFYQLNNYTSNEAEVLRVYEKNRQQVMMRMRVHNLTKPKNKSQVPRALKTRMRSKELMKRKSFNSQTSEDVMSSLSSVISEGSTELLLKPRDAAVVNRRTKLELASGLNSEKKKKIASLIKYSQRKINTQSKIGEADRRIYDNKPKHLFSGKRTMGSNSRR